MKRTFEFADDKTTKFWSIEINGNEFTVSYGKTGTKGKTSEESFDSKEKCLKEADKLAISCIKKGYIEIVTRPINIPDDVVWNSYFELWMAMRPAGSNYIASYDKNSGLYISYAKNARQDPFIGELRSWTRIGEPHQSRVYTKTGNVNYKYHPNGTIAVQSEYTGSYPTCNNATGFGCSTLNGVLIMQRCAVPSPHVFPLRFNDVWKIVRHYENAKHVSTEYFDKDGNLIDAAFCVRQEKVLADTELAEKSIAGEKAQAIVVKPKAKSDVRLPACDEDMEAFPKGTVGLRVPTEEATAMLFSGKYFDKIKLNIKNIARSAANLAYALVIEGDVHVKGDFLTSEDYELYSQDFSMIIIKGNLTIDGTARIGCEYGIPFFVLGELSVKNIIAAEVAVVVHGDVRLSGMLLFLYEGEFAVNGRFAAHDGYYARDSYLEANGTKDVKGFLTAADFLDEYISRDEEYGIEYGIAYDIIEGQKVIDAMYAGKEILK